MSVYPAGVHVRKQADLSSDGIYRYWLSREWGAQGDPASSLPFVMLNPSTADAAQDDQTIRKCVGFARRLGYDGITVFNLYAYRATDPRGLLSALRSGVDVVGPENDQRIRGMFTAHLDAGQPVVAAWGAHAREERVRQVLTMPGAETLRALALTSKGVPRHPLTLGYDSASLTGLLPPIA